jgi:hypothetical protein
MFASRWCQQPPVFVCPQFTFSFDALAKDSNFSDVAAMLLVRHQMTHEMGLPISFSLRRAVCLHRKRYLMTLRSA